MRKTFDFFLSCNYAGGMFKALSQETLESWGLKGKASWSFNGLDVWDQVSKGNIQSDIVGRAVVIVAARVVNDHFATKKEWIMNQPELFEYVLEKVFETRIVGGGLLRKFPERPSNGARVRGYLIGNARSWLYEIIGKLVRRKEIAEMGESIEDVDHSWYDADEAESWVNRLVAEQNSKIIKKEQEKTHDDEEESEKKEKVPQGFGHLSKKVTNPEIRQIIEEELGAQLEEVKRKGRRVSKRMEESIARAEGTRVMLGMDRKFYSFPSVDEMVLSCQDLTPLDDYYFVHIPKDAKIIKELYPEDQHGVIQEMNEGSLRRLREQMDGDGTVIGFPLWDGASLRLTDPNAYGIQLYSETEELNGLNYDDVLEVTDAWQMFDLKKKSHLFLYRSDRQQIEDDDAVSNLGSGVYVLFDGQKPVYAGQGPDCGQRLREQHKTQRVPFSAWTHMPIQAGDERKAEEKRLLDLMGLRRRG